MVPPTETISGVTLMRGPVVAVFSTGTVMCGLSTVATGVKLIDVEAAVDDAIDVVGVAVTVVVVVMVACDDEVDVLEEAPCSTVA